ncbi:MAG: hypothetical protein QOE77_4050 [Blastocatellia bacterium]|nr:hypothetical protein [Blastocatellia bacterium]
MGRPVRQALGAYLLLGLVAGGSLALGGCRTLPDCEELPRDPRCG